jgi:hypothetical protein
MILDFLRQGCYGNTGTIVCSMEVLEVCKNLQKAMEKFQLSRDAGALGLF